MILIDDSYKGGISVTPSDTDNITFPSGTLYSKAVYVGTTGDLKAIMADGTTLLFKTFPAGLHRISVKRVYDTDTTAEEILALY